MKSPRSSSPAGGTRPSASPGTRQARTSARPALDQSAMQRLVGYNIRRAELHMRQVFDSSVGASGLKPSEFSILVLVASNPLATQTGLGSALSIKRPNMVVLVEGLARRGLLVRAEHEQDSRMQTLHLTSKGLALLTQTQRLSREAELRATRCWSAGERRQVIALLRRFYEQD